MDQILVPEGSDWYWLGGERKTYAMTVVMTRRVIMIGMVYAFFLYCSSAYSIRYWLSGYFLLYALYYFSVHSCLDVSSVMDYLNGSWCMGHRIVSYCMGYLNAFCLY